MGESFKMAAIRDGLGRVRVAGEAIYQRRRKIERQRERDILARGLLRPRWWPLPPPFSSSPPSILSFLSSISSASYP